MRRLKMRERRSLHRYYETFGSDVQISVLAFRFVSFVLPVLAFLGLSAWASAHATVFSHSTTHSTHIPMLAGMAVLAAPEVVSEEAKKSARGRDILAARAKLVDEMLDLTKDNGSWNTSVNGKEASARWLELSALVDQMARQANAIARTEALEANLRGVAAPPQAQPGSTSIETTTEGRVSDKFVKELRERLESKEYKSAFFSWVRRGDNRISDTERRLLDDTQGLEARVYIGLNEGTGSQGGYTVPIGFQRELEITMKAYGRMLANCRILETSTGNTLDWPTMDDTANTGNYLTEASPVTQQNPTFGQVQLSSFLASSQQVLISVQLLQDSAFDVESELREAFGIRLGRIVNLKTTLGSGTNEPQGLVYAIQNDAVPNIVNAVGSNSNDGISGNTEANSVGSDDLDNLIANVDPAYRPNAKFMMNWKTIDFLRKVKDKYGRPLWVASLAVGEPDRIFGYPYDWNADMQVVGAGNYPILFGDFSKHIIRTIGGVTFVRYNELYMPNHQIGFQAYLRNDSRRIQQKAFALLYNPLS